MSTGKNSKNMLKLSVEKDPFDSFCKKLACYWTNFTRMSHMTSCMYVYFIIAKMAKYHKHRVEQKIQHTNTESESQSQIRQ